MTMTQRSIMSTTKPITTLVNVLSIEIMNNGLPSAALRMLQGIIAIHRIAKTVPTQFACIECQMSPRTKSAKLVVMPQDGQGSPVNVLKVQGGNPSCVCVSIRQVVPP